MVLLRYALIRWLRPRIEPHMTWHAWVALVLFVLTSHMAAAKYNELNPLPEAPYAVERTVP
jgi:hypothetical protein